MIEQILQADRYLQVDQVDRARDVYQKVVDADPGNAIAVVGLARCALAQGEDARAHELASRALEIDPENDMARRMEARLSEILSTRGQPVERPEAAASANPGRMRPMVTETPDEPSAVPSAAQPATTVPSNETGPSTRPPAQTKESAVRKSLLDRLLGR